MFTNMYQIEQDGRMKQQSLLEAQYAQDLAHAAVASHGEATHQPTMPHRFRHNFVRPLVLGGRVTLLLWLVLIGLVVFALAAEPAAAADHAGNATGGRASVVSDGRASDGYRPVVDPASDTSMFAVDDAASGRSITAINDPGDAAGTNAVVDSGGTNAWHGTVAVATSDTHGVEIQWLEGMALMVLIAIVLVHARWRPRASA